MDQPLSRTDSFCDFDRELERGGGLEAGNSWGAAGGGAFDESGQLALQWFFALNLDFVAFQPLRGPSIHFPGLVLVIERQIHVLLKDADLAHLLGTDPAGSNIRDAAVLETNPRVGDVFALAQNWHADGVNALHRRSHEMQNDFQVVDHQIENNP